MEQIRTAIFIKTTYNKAYISIWEWINYIKYQENANMKCQNENTIIFEIVTNIKSKYVFLQFLYMKNESGGCS